MQFVWYKFFEVILAQERFQKLLPKQHMLSPDFQPSETKVTEQWCLSPIVFNLFLNDTLVVFGMYKAGRNLRNSSRRRNTKAVSWRGWLWTRNSQVFIWHMVSYYTYAAVLKHMTIMFCGPKSPANSIPPAFSISIHPISDQKKHVSTNKF